MAFAAAFSAVSPAPTFAAIAPSISSGDASFQAARAAFARGDALRLKQSMDALAGHPLQPWAGYWRLRLKLEDRADGNNNAEIGEFLAAQGNTYLGDRLRGDWLRKMGERGDWENFNREWAALVQRDTELECFAAQAAGAPERIRPQWLSGQDLPPACMNVIDKLADAGGLTTEDVWQRLRRRLEAKKLNVASTTGFLPGSETFVATGLDTIAQRPLAYLDKMPARTTGFVTRGTREKVLFALQRLAQTDVAKAISRLEDYEAHAPRFTVEERAYAWGQIGVAAAMKHMPEAVKCFDRSAATTMTDFQLAWQARAALRVRDWSALRRAIAAMPPTLAAQPDWIYWQGRALAAQGQEAEARKLFQKISGQPNFYGNLADDELGRVTALPPQAARITSVELDAAAANPGLQRALALLRLDQRPDALKEWAWTLRGMDDRQLLAAAEYARQQGVWDRAIHAADRTQSQHDYSLRYLAPFREKVEPAARGLALDGAWVYGLMRQESRFLPAAKSSVGAQGLMQVMPATAKWVAKQIGFTSFHPANAADLDVNIKLGTNYLKMVLDSLDNHPVLASAAYNAGPGRARKWRSDQPLEGAIYAETIPFTETRDYVKKVMSNAMYYNALFNDKPQSLKARLGTIAPRGAGEKGLGDMP